MGTSVKSLSEGAFGDAERHVERHAKRNTEQHAERHVERHAKRNAERLRFAELVEPKQVEDFLEMIPQEWSDILRPWMERYLGEPNLYGVFQGDALIGGGAIFSTSPPPETETYREECLARFSEGQAYIGFLWVSTEFRGMGAGQFWLHALMHSALNKEQSTSEERGATSYWLTIEDPALIHFYEKAGFRVVKELEGDEGPEWLLSTQG